MKKEISLIDEFTGSPFNMAVNVDCSDVQKQQYKSLGIDVDLHLDNVANKMLVREYNLKMFKSMQQFCRDNNLVISLDIRDQNNGTVLFDMIEDIAFKMANCVFVWGHYKPIALIETQKMLKNQQILESDKGFDNDIKNVYLLKRSDKEKKLTLRLMFDDDKGDSLLVYDGWEIRDCYLIELLHI